MISTILCLWFGSNAFVFYLLWRRPDAKLNMNTSSMASTPYLIAFRQELLKDILEEQIANFNRE